MLTKSFKKGFGDGFTSPFNLFVPSSIELPEPASVGRAWDSVVQIMAESIAKEAGKFEEGQKKVASKAKSRR